jgi:hypothetical protein
MIPLDETYIPPKEMRMKTGIATPSIDPSNPRKVILKITESLKLNHNYVIVLDKDIKSTSGASLGQTQMATFSTEYAPLYATPLEVFGVIKKLFSQFELSDVYQALRNAGQKAHQLLGQIPDPNVVQFRMLTERDAAYFPATKFVVYEAARVLLTSLIMRIANDQGVDTNGISGSVTLGDLTVSEGTSSGGGSAKPADPTTIVKNALTQLNDEHKFWQDAMLGRNRRGYTTPVSTGFRTSAGSPTTRGFE